MSKCTDMCMYPLDDEVIECECINERLKDEDHIHEWKKIRWRLRCSRQMNDFRCDLWRGHGNDCHSKKLMFALTGR